MSDLIDESVMTRPDIHESSDFFEYVRVTDSEPPADSDRIDVAILDMNHSWPNVGHDSLVHAVLEAAEPLRETLVAAGSKVRVLSYDVRRTLRVPKSPDGRFRLYIGTGGPGHLDPRENDGVNESSQGIVESAAWEAPLFRLYDDIAAHESAMLLGVCHSFGLMCRWSGAARVALRTQKSMGMPENVLSDSGASHPWFSQFARRLSDGRHFRVVDNRLFDLIANRSSATSVIAREDETSDGVTMIEFARAADGMPRVFGVNHHPEIVDREHIMTVLEEKRAHGEVSESWYGERVVTLRDLFSRFERDSRLTSEYTLLGPLRFHLGRLIEERVGGSAAAQTVAHD
jgi:anthranilate/para-aminobenzoate synthase component II